MTHINFSNINKSFGPSYPVIKNVNLDIGNGEFCVFLGPSGCGKSTLLRMVAGLETGYEGEIRIAGSSVDAVQPANRQVSMVFQNYALYPHMTVRDNMGFGLKQAKTPKADIARRVDEAAHILQIEPLLERMPRALSGGQRQRVAIGRAIVRKPKVFLFDEPLSNLDASLRIHMRTEIATLHRNFPTASMIYVTHDQTEAMALADKIVLLHAGDLMLKHGSIAQVGGPLELYHHPRSLFVAGFLGSPTMNFLSGHFVGVEDGMTKVRLADGQVVAAAVSGQRLLPNEAVTLGIRPEHLRSDSAAGRQVLVRKVEAVEEFGEHSLVYLRGTTGEALVAKVVGGWSQSGDGDASFAAPPEDLHVFDAEGIALPRWLAACPPSANKTF